VEKERLEEIAFEARFGPLAQNFRLRWLKKGRWKVWVDCHVKIQRENKIKQQHAKRMNRIQNVVGLLEEKLKVLEEENIPVKEELKIKKPEEKEKMLQKAVKEKKIKEKEMNKNNPEKLDLKTPLCMFHINLKPKKENTSSCSSPSSTLLSTERHEKEARERRLARYWL
jgi:hypothetical protein